MLATLRRFAVAAISATVTGPGAAANAPLGADRHIPYPASLLTLTSSAC